MSSPTSFIHFQWSGDGRELIAGTNDERVYVYDAESSRVIAFAAGHSDDVNAVAYLNNGDGNVFASGSDDGIIKVVTQVWGRGKDVCLDDTGGSATASGSVEGPILVGKRATVGVGPSPLPAWAVRRGRCTCRPHRGPPHIPHLVCRRFGTAARWTRAGGAARPARSLATPRASRTWTRAAMAATFCPTQRI
eukprot:366040-Chlamydomonas_euryale.AAC.1